MNWQVIKGLKEQRGKVFTDSNAILELSRKENRDLTPDENTRHAAMLTEIETFNTRIAREERVLAMGELANAAGKEPTPGRDNSVDMPDKDFKRYSVLRALDKMIKGERLDGIEREASDEIAKRTGATPRGFFVPTDVRKNLQRSLNAATTGVGSIETTTTKDFIDVLRAKTVTGKVGATFLTGLQGKVAIPRKTAAANVYWVGEGGSPSAGQPSIDQVILIPKTIAAYTDITRQFVKQTSLDAEAFVLDDLTKGIGVGVDIAAFVGSGTSNQPQGIVGATGVSTIAMGTNGAQPTFPTVIAMETAVAVANADMGSLGYVTTPAARGYLKGTPKSSSAVAAGFIWEDGEVNGYNAWATNILPANGTKGTGTNLSTMVFGNFEDLIIAMWGSLDLLIDPYSGSTSGTVRVVAMQDCDIELRHGQSFSVITDLVTV